MYIMLKEEHMARLRRSFVASALIFTLVAAPITVRHSYSAGNATIQFLTPPWGIPANQQALKAFERQSGVTVQITSVPMAQLYSKVQVASAAHRSPADVIFLTEEAPSNIVGAQDVQSLNSLISATPGLNTKDIQRLSFWNVGGQQYGVTSYVQLVMLDYNAAKLRKAGYATPRSWDELNSEAMAVKKKGIDSYPVAMAASDWSWYLMALSMGDPMFDTKLNPTFTAKNSAGRRAMALLIKFYKEGLISPTELTQPTPHVQYESGVGAFHQSWEGALAVMNNPKISKQAPNVRYMLLPDKHNTWSLDAGLGISTHSTNVQAAWTFIQWYLQPAQQRDIYNAYGLIPSRLSVQKSLAIQGADVIDQQSRYVHQLPRYASWWGTWTSAVTQDVRMGFVGQMNSDQIIDDLGAQWNNLRGQYSGH